MTALARVLSTSVAQPLASSQSLSGKHPAVALLYQQQHLYALWLSAAKQGYSCRFYQHLSADAGQGEQPFASLLLRMASLLKRQFGRLPPAMVGLDEQHYQQQQLTLQARPALAQQVQEHLQQQLTTPANAATGSAAMPPAAQHYRVDFQAQQQQCRLAVAHEQPLQQLEQQFRQLHWPLAVIEPRQQSRLRGLCHYLPQCWAQLAEQQLPADWCLLCNAGFGLLQCYRGEAAQWQQQQILPVADVIAELDAQPASLCLLDVGVDEREQLQQALTAKLPLIALDEVQVADISGLPAAIDCQLLGLALRGFYSCHI